MSHDKKIGFVAGIMFAISMIGFLFAYFGKENDI